MQRFNLNRTIHALVSILIKINTNKKEKKHSVMSSNSEGSSTASLGKDDDEGFKHPQ